MGVYAEALLFKLTNIYPQLDSTSLVDLLAKALFVSENWQSIWQGAHSKAFTVAGLNNLNLLQTLKSQVQTALQAGKSEKWFVDTLTPILQKEGWWGKKEVINPITGESKIIKQGSGQRLKLIYRQNLQTAYSAGGYRRKLAKAEDFPYWQYVSKGDARVRLAHQALHGRVFRYDDVFWQSHYPPNGFLCRCEVISLSARDLKEQNLQVETAEGKLYTSTIEQKDSSTGEVYSREVVGYKPTKGSVFYTDLGFSYNPGQAAFGADLELAKKLDLVRDKVLYEDVVSLLNHSEIRQEYFAGEVEKIIKTRHSNVKALVVGFTPKKAVNFAKAKGLEPGQFLTLSDNQLLHADSNKHKRDGIALSLAEYQGLAKSLAEYEEILWDNQNENFSFVCTDKDPEKKILIVVDVPSQRKRLRQVGKLDTIVNAYRTDKKILKNDVRYIKVD